MKHISEFNPNNIDMESPEAMKRVTTFVLYISKLYPIQTKNIDAQELQNIALSYKSRVLRYDDRQLRKRLETLKKLIDALAPEVEHFSGALKVSVSNTMALNQLKRKYYPTGSDAKALQAHKPLKRLEKLNTKDPLAEVNKLKDLFND